MESSQLKSWFLSLMMLFTLMYQSVHLWEHSLEKSKTTQQIHQIKKGKLKHSISEDYHCSICDFHFLANDFDFSINLIPEKFEIPFSKKSEAEYLSFYTSSFHHICHLRAPPRI